MSGRSRCDDEGFSLVEVMFAAFIAFFILTALFGVLVSSTGIGRLASMDTIATDLAQLVVEQARAMPYESVGTTSATGVDAVVGSLAATETTTFQTLSFDVNREVIWVRDALGSGIAGDYKQLTVRVGWKGGHATKLVTFLRDHTTKPIIEPVITTFSSPSGQIIYLDEDTGLTWAYNPSGPPSAVVAVVASASVPATIGTVTRLEIRVNGLLARDPFLCDVRSTDRWPNPGWVIDLHSDETSGQLFHEGVNLVSFLAYGSNMGYSSHPYEVIVDNDPPVFPAGATFDLLPPEKNIDRFYSKLDMRFTRATDGTGTIVQSYGTAIGEGGGAAVVYPPDPDTPGRIRDLGVEGTSTLTTEAPVAFAPQPFTVYGVALTPYSPRSLPGAAPLVSNLAVTAPRLNGICYDNRTIGSIHRHYYRLSVSPPRPGPTELAELLGGTGDRVPLVEEERGGLHVPGRG